MLRSVIEKEDSGSIAAAPSCRVGQPSVAILLATFNSAGYLDEQLWSIRQQTHRNWFIAVSDDGSSDATLDSIRRYQEEFGAHRLRLQQGPRRGYAANFLSLICDASIEADCFAFCDQDDIWQRSHLERAINWLSRVPEDRPALHCGRTHLVNAAGESLGVSPLFAKQPSFGNALVQSLAGGNTMVFNAAARKLLSRAGQLEVVSHDWWAYLMVSGAGGIVHYDSVPSVDYRQHGRNLVGANSSFKERLYRLKRLFAGDFREWNSINLAALECCRELLAKPQRQTLDCFISARKGRFVKRCLGMQRAGVYRQTLSGNLGLIAATILNKI